MGDAGAVARAAKLVVLVAVGAAVVGAFLWHVFGERVTEVARRALEERLGRALHTPVAARRLGIALFPPRLRAEGFALGPGGDALRVGTAGVRFLPYDSLRELRPVVELEAADLWLDVAALARGVPVRRPKRARWATVPFHLRRVQVANLHIRAPAGGSALDVTVAALTGHVAAGAGSEHVRAEIAAERIELRREAEQLLLDRVAVAFADTRRGLELSRLEARGAGIRLDAAAQGGDLLRHLLTAEISLPLPGRLRAPLQEFAGRVQIEATLSGPLQNPAVVATVRGGPVSWHGEVIDAVRAELAREGARIELRAAHVAGFEGQLDARGTVELSDDKPFHIEAAWQHVDAARVAARAGIRIASGGADGHAQLSGTLGELALDGSGAGRFTVAGGASRVEWHAAVRRDTSGTKIDVNLIQGENALRAGAAISPQRVLTGDAELRIRDAAALSALLWDAALPKPGGRLLISARLAGSVSDPVATGTVTAERVAAFGVVVERAAGGFTLDRAGVQTDGLVLQFGGGTVRGVGRVGFSGGAENAWAITLREVGVDALLSAARNAARVELPIQGGAVSGTLTGRGQWSQLAFDGEAKVGAFRLWREPFEQFGATVSGIWPAWCADARLIHRGAEHLTGRLSGRAAEEITVEVDSTTWSLEELRGAGLARLSGRASLSAQLQGPPTALSGWVVASAAELQGAGVRWGGVTAEAVAERGSWRIQAAVLDEALRLRARVSHEPGWPFTAEGEWSDVRVQVQPAAGPELRVATSGSAWLSGRVDAWPLVDGGAQIDHLTVAGGAYALRATAPIRARMVRGRCSVESLNLEGDGTRIDISGDFDTQGAAHLTARGRGELQVLEMLGAPIQSARGHVALEIALTRTAAGALDLTGEAAVADGALDIGLPFGVTETNGRIVLRGSTVRIEQLTGRMGGGTFAIGGGVDLAEGPALTWQVANVSTGLIPSLDHEISGTGSVSGRWEDLTVAGEVEVLRLLYDRRIELIDFLPSLRRTLPKPPAVAVRPSRVIRLDLRVIAPDEIFIDNNFARIEARADVRASGTATDPHLTGTIEVLTGEVFFRGRTFEVTSAVVEFHPELGLAAYLNISAETAIDTHEGAYTVTVQVTGTTDDYRVAMSADDPGLSQNDIASLIAFGKTGAHLQREGAGISMPDLLALAPGGYSERVERGAASLLGLDRVDIAPAFSRRTGAFEPQITLGKDFTEKLTASVSTTFGVETRRIVGLEYRLTRRISLLGSWESETETEAGAFGGDIKFRYEFRRLPRFSLVGGAR